MRQIQSHTSPLLKPVLSASIQRHKTHHQRSWTLAHREHFDHGNSSVKAKTNKGCTSNTKTFCWWNSIFRLLVSSILVPCVWLHTNQSLQDYNFQIRPMILFDFFYIDVLVISLTLTDFTLFPSETKPNWYILLKWAWRKSCLHNHLFVYFIYPLHNAGTHNTNKTHNLILYGLSLLKNAVWQLLLTSPAVKCTSKLTNQASCTSIKVKSA